MFEKRGKDFNDNCRNHDEKTYQRNGKIASRNIYNIKSVLQG